MNSILVSSPGRPMDYRDIQGWFNFEGEYQRAVAMARLGAKFVEVGAWRGKSTAFLASEVKRSGKNIELNVVDTWRGSNEDYHQQVVRAAGGDLFPEFWENMRNLQVDEFVRPHRMHSVDAAQRFDDDSVDFCYIDASHDFQSVRNDLRAWLPKIRSDGVIAGHDIHCDDVKAAVQDAIPWTQVEIINGSTWWWEKSGRSNGEWQSQVDLKYSLPSHVLCIPCVVNVSLLEKAVCSILNDEANIAVFDTSGHDLNLTDASWLDRVSLFKTAARPTFTQAMNLIQRECRRLRVRWLVVMHSDAACSDFDVLHDLLTRAENLNATQRVGVLSTGSDAFCAFNMDAVEDVGPWDETFEWHPADKDYYHRLRLRGWTVDGDTSLQTRVQHLGEMSIKSDDLLAQRTAERFSHQRMHLEHKWRGAKRVPYQS